MAEQARDTLGDREAEPEALAAAVESPEFLEDHLAIPCRDAGTRVPHFERELAVSPAAAEQDASSLGVAHGVRQEILQHPAQELRIALHPGLRRDAFEREAPLRGEHPELRREVLQHFR